MNDLTVAIIAVGHDYYKEMGLENIMKQCRKPCIIMDISGLFRKEVKEKEDLIYWKL